MSEFYGGVEYARIEAAKPPPEPRVERPHVEGETAFQSAINAEMESMIADINEQLHSESPMLKWLKADDRTKNVWHQLRVNRAAYLNPFLDAFMAEFDELRNRWPSIKMTGCDDGDVMFGFGASYEYRP